jgi:hypothetical protein
MSIFAWRLWTIKHNNLLPSFTQPAKYELCGLYDQPWTMGVMEARCASVSWHYSENLHSGEVAPGVACQCGIYACRQEYIPEKCNCSMHLENMILGVVEIWGKIIVADYGYRAQFARIRTMIDAPAFVAQDFSVSNLPSVEYARKEYFS